MFPYPVGFAAFYFTSRGGGNATSFSFSPMLAVAQRHSKFSGWKAPHALRFVERARDRQRGERDTEIDGDGEKKEK